MAFVIGLVIGSILGLTGAGGSIFAVPLLLLVLGLSLPDAIGVAMAAVAVSAVYGSLKNWRSNNVLWIQAGLLGVSGVAVAPAGRWLGAQLDETLLLLGFSLLAWGIAARMYRQATQNPEVSRVLRSSKLAAQAPTPSVCRLSSTGRFQWGLRCVGSLLLSGSIVGLLTGLFGVGGGFLIVPLLMVLNQVSIQQAIASSLVIIAAVSSSGFISYMLASPSVDYDLLTLIALGGVLGMFFGQLVATRVAGPRLQKVFAVCLSLIALVNIFTQLR